MIKKIGLVQMMSGSNVSENIDFIEHYCVLAHKGQIDLLVLPENFAFMGINDADKLLIAENYGSGFIQDKISYFARYYNLWIVAGTIPLKEDLANKVKSACLVFNDQGFCVARYDKIHLFDVSVAEKEAYQESLFVTKGNQLALVDTPVGRIGLTICYDLRFSELYYQLLLQGAEIFTVPAAFTAITGEAHWQVLLRARAIENLCYVLAPNQGGLHENGRETYGHSMIIDPWGKILVQSLEKSGLIVAEIDLEYLRKLRRQFPCNEHHVLGR